jgi:hypothetical protein
MTEIENWVEGDCCAFRRLVLSLSADFTRSEVLCKHPKHSGTELGMAKQTNRNVMVVTLQYCPTAVNGWAFRAEKAGVLGQIEKKESTPIVHMFGSDQQISFCTMAWTNSCRLWPVPILALLRLNKVSVRIIGSFLNGRMRNVPGPQVYTRLQHRDLDSLSFLPSRSSV